MRSREQPQGHEKAGSEHWSSRVAIDDSKAPAQMQAHPAALLIRRARVDPRSLSQSHVLQLERAFGNQAVGGLLTPAPRSGRAGLPAPLWAGVEFLSGISMHAVSVHYNSPRPAGLAALAYTQGAEIRLAPGQERHLPHEAWHVVQQAQGRVQPTMQLQDGASVNDDAGLEREADVMGARALTAAREPTSAGRTPRGTIRQG